jgi:hypothetical protein
VLQSTVSPPLSRFGTLQKYSRRYFPVSAFGQWLVVLKKAFCGLGCRASVFAELFATTQSASDTELEYARGLVVA